MKNKTGVIQCRKCNHTWKTKSKLKTIICASCGTKNLNKKEEDCDNVS